jgi:hypothetical protein
MRKGPGLRPRACYLAVCAAGGHELPAGYASGAIVDGASSVARLGATPYCRGNALQLVGQV